MAALGAQARTDFRLFHSRLRVTSAWEILKFFLVRWGKLDSPDSTLPVATFGNSIRGI